MHVAVHKQQSSKALRVVSVTYLSACKLINCGVMRLLEHVHWSAAHVVYKLV
jgi:hypothetical protein